MAIVRYCILTSGSNLCVEVFDWDNTYTYTPNTGYIIAGDGTGDVGGTYSNGTSPGGTWSYPSSGPVLEDPPAPVTIEEGGTNASTAAGALTNLGAAPLASPTFTGTPAAPTPAADTNTTQLATTAFVVGQASSTTPAVNGTAAVGTSLKFARADHVHGTDTSRAPLASPTFTGTPAAPSAAAYTDTTQIATTAHVYDTVTSVMENGQVGTSYTLVLTDAGKLITLSNAAAITLTIPTNASVAFPIGTRIDLAQYGAGQVTVGGAGVTIRSSGSKLKLAGQYSGATLWKKTTNEWLLIGDISA